jgi:hypothetical protein
MQKESLVPEITEAYYYIENLRGIINVIWPKIDDTTLDDNFSTFTQKLQDYYGELFKCLEIIDAGQRQIKVDSIKNDIAKESTYLLNDASSFFWRRSRDKLNRKLMMVVDRTDLESEFSELTESYTEALKSFETWKFDKAIKTFNELIGNLLILDNKIIIIWRAVGKRDLILFIMALVGFIYGIYGIISGVRFILSLFNK